MKSLGGIYIEIEDCSPFVQRRHHQRARLLQIDVDAAEAERAHFWSDVGPHAAGDVKFVDESSPAIVWPCAIVVCQIQDLLLGRKNALVGELSDWLAGDGSP